MIINYARETLDRLRSKEKYFALIAPSNFPDSFIPTGEDFEVKHGGTRSYTVELGPNDYATSSGERYKIIEVTADWTE